MKFLNNLVNPLHHCEDAAIQLCKSLNVKITTSTLKKDITEHPDYPGLTSISDVLNQYGVTTLPLKFKIEHLDKLPKPFIAHIKGKTVKHNLFAVVLSYDSHKVIFYNPETKTTDSVSTEEFSNRYLNVILAVEVNEEVGEKEYDKIKKAERYQNLIQTITIFLIPLIVCVSIFVAFITAGIQATGPVLFGTITLVGSIIAVLLLFHEVDEYNTAVNQICQTTKKVNCSAILNSKGSQIFGFSWSLLGSVYFFGILISLLTGGITNSQILFLLSWINVFALPYIIYSLSYQYFVAKQWCILCLGVQAVLLTQFIAGFLSGFHNKLHYSEITIQSFLTVIASFAVVFTALLLLIPALEKAKQSRQNNIALQRLKNNRQIFEALLDKQKMIGNTADGLGIVLGKSDAKNKLVKVCNPYCKPCAQAHPLLEELLENSNDLQVQIIFNATTDEMMVRPAKHLLAIAEQQATELTKRALDDWYLPTKKDYNAFAEKYPLLDGIEKQNLAIQTMDKWCKEAEITFTPTFFINGYQLPEIYTVADLKYLLTK
jgi:uncharacterized membrane protein